MSVTINGTSGVTTPGIANSEGYSGDGLTIAAGAPAGAITINSTYQTFSPNGSEAMRLDASGNLGLGVTPSAWTRKAIQLDGGGAGYIVNGTGNMSVGRNLYYNGAYKYINTGAAAMFDVSSGSFQWYTAPSGTAGNPITFTQAMTLDASGNLLVGTTSTFLGDQNSTDGLTVSPTGRISAAFTNSGQWWYLNKRGADGAVIIMQKAGSTVGSISVSGSSTTYATSSDYRLKENVAPLTNALDKIASLKPCTFTWKADGSADRGFIAHELQEVIPQAVSGEKDAVDDKGNIMPQGVDYGKITPEIVAAIQELKARIEQLEAK